MLHAAESPDLCWWCRKAPADSREHKLKRSDLVRQFETGPYPGLVSERDGRTRHVQGPPATLRSSRRSLCARCNNERSQPFDLAYDMFTGYLHEHERHVLASRSVDLRSVYGDDWKSGRDSLLRYMAKHVGCRLAENAIEVPTSIRGYLVGGPEPAASSHWSLRSVWTLHERRGRSSRAEACGWATCTSAKWMRADSR